MNMNESECVGRVACDVTTRQGVRVYAEIVKGDLRLWRMSDGCVVGDDIPCTVVSRSALLKLSQGPFENGQVTDCL